MLRAVAGELIRLFFKFALLLFQVFKILRILNQENPINNHKENILKLKNVSRHGKAEAEAYSGGSMGAQPPPLWTSKIFKF